MKVLAAVWLLNLVTRRLVDALLIMSNEGVYVGEFWRLLTAALTSGGLFGLLMNLLVLWIAGRALESELGGWRTIAAPHRRPRRDHVDVRARPDRCGGYGASAAVLGLFAANAIFGTRPADIRRHRAVPAADRLSVLVGFRSFGFLLLIGGIVVGALVGAVLAYAPRQNRSLIQVVGLLSIALLCLEAVVAKLTLGWSPPTPRSWKTSSAVSGGCRVTSQATMPAEATQSGWGFSSAW